MVGGTYGGTLGLTKSLGVSRELTPFFEVVYCLLSEPWTTSTGIIDKPQANN